MTQLLNAAQPADLHTAIALLQRGELVAVPTETVYGLAADISQPEAVAKIFVAKQRPADHPLIVHIGAVAQLAELAINIPAIAYQLAEQYWPGPLTLVLDKAPTLDPIVTGGLNSVAMRMPAHPALLNMLKIAKLMLAAPSANPHKALSPTSAGQVMDSMSGKLAAVLDGGECQLGIESTILDLTSATPCVLRAGPITADELSIFLQREVIHLRTHSHKVSGNLREHYRPKTPLFLKTAEQMQEHRDYPVARLLLGFAPEEIDVSITLNRRMPSEKQAYARLLYKALYELDQSGAQEIWVQLPPTTHEWLDVYDRLKRAVTNIPE